MPKELWNLVTEYYLFVFNVQHVAGSEGKLQFQDGTELEGRFTRSTVFDFKKNRILFTDNHTIRSFQLKTSSIQTIAGAFLEANHSVDLKDCSLEEASFSFPSGIAIDPSEDTIIVSDQWNKRIVKIDETKRSVMTIASDMFIGNLCCDTHGNIFLTDATNQQIKQLQKSQNPNIYKSSNIVKIAVPTSITIDCRQEHKTMLYVSGVHGISVSMDDNSTQYAIYHIDPLSKMITRTFYFDDEEPLCIRFDSVNGGLYIGFKNYVCYYNPITDQVEELHCNAWFASVQGIEIDHNTHGTLYVFDTGHYKVFQLA
jgi:DNA-binding beta-propeller fold protein YncE